IQYANNILATLRGSADQSAWAEEEYSRIQSIITSVQDLRDELEEQTSKRMQLERETWKLQSRYKEVKSQSSSIEIQPTLERAATSIDQPNETPIDKHPEDQPFTSNEPKQPTEEQSAALPPLPLSEPSATKDEPEAIPPSLPILDSKPAVPPHPESTVLVGSNDQ
ncbi:9763_t:CDS:1, partial [Acaulospora colombiana]